MVYIMHKLLIVFNSSPQELNTAEFLFILKADMAFCQPLTGLGF